MILMAIYCKTLTVNSEIFATVYFREMEKSLCVLLKYVNHALVANFERRKYVF